MLLNCGIKRDSWESLRLQGDQTQSVLKESTLNIHWKTDAEAEAPILWPPDAKSQLIEKDSNARKDRRQEEKGMTEHKMIGWHHQLNGHKSEHAGDDGG